MSERPEDGEPLGRQGPSGPLEGKANETRDLPARPETNHTGDKRSAKNDLASVEGADALVDASRVIARFSDATRAKLKDRTREEYVRCFQRLCRKYPIERHSIRVLAGPTGRRLILDYLQTLNKASWAARISALTAVWQYGMGVGFPVRETDLPRLPPVGRRQSPRAERVRPWIEAMDKQPDTFMRVIWLMYGELGLRPSHVANLLWSDVVWDDKGQPYAIVASGASGRFKTFADVKARLPPSLVEALDQWSKETPRPGSDKPILPWRGCTGKFLPRKLNTDQMSALWAKFRKQWGLGSLTPNELRHHTKTVGHKAGMDEVALCLMMGHKPEGMGGQYDNPEDDEDIFDRQRSVLPLGALATINPPEVREVPGVEPLVLQTVFDYMAGSMSTLEFASKMENLRLKAQVPASSGSGLVR